MHQAAEINREVPLPDIVQSLLGRFRAGAITRRDFMTRAGALGVTASVGTSLMGATALSAPNKGGRFRLGIAHSTTTDTIHPATYSTFICKSSAAPCATT